MQRGGDSDTIQSTLPDMDIGVQKMQAIPKYHQNGGTINNAGQNLFRRNVGENDKESDEYWLHRTQNENKEVKNSLECSEGKNERKNTDVKEKDEETYRTELIKILKLDFVGMPEGFEDWNFEQLKEWVTKTGCKINKIPNSLSFMMPGFARPGDCGRSATEKPEWFDLDLFRRGQKFAMANFFSISCANVISLCMCFTDREILKPLIITGRSNTPYRAFKRYLSTLIRERNWYAEDPWEEGSAAYKDIAIVRRYHDGIRNRLCNSSREKIEEDSTISDPWSSIRDVFVEDASAACPLNSNLYDITTKLKYRSFGITQTEMSFTQFAFIALIITYPEAFGIHNADEADLEAFCHVWRSIGYLLGIEDEYNFCCGSLRETKQRSRDAIDMIIIPNLRTAHAEWEHMSRCLVRGMTYIAPTPSYETLILYMTDMLKIPMPRLLASVDYIIRIRVAFLKFFFYYIIRIPGMRQIANTILNKYVEKALAFSPKKHSSLEEKSTKTLLDFTLG